MERFKNKKFEDYAVSTKTFIAYTNLVLDIDKLYGVLPITEYVVIQKKRGRKKKVQEENPNKDIQDGSIIKVQNGSNFRGVEGKKNSRGKYFRNSMTFVIYIDGKLLNSKVSRNGKFQITGCKKDTQAERCIHYFWTYISKFKTLYSFSEGEHLKTVYDPVMYNIDFSLGFEVNRENLDKYINTNTEYYSILETTFGYTGVNIKIPVTTCADAFKVKQIEYVEGEQQTSYMTYDLFQSQYRENRKKESNKHNTFLVFQSGKVIMSGKSALFMEGDYYRFINIIRDCYSEINNKLD